MSWGARSCGGTARPLAPVRTQPIPRDCNSAISFKLDPCAGAGQKEWVARRISVLVLRQPPLATSS